MCSLLPPALHGNDRIFRIAIVENDQVWQYCRERILNYKSFSNLFCRVLRLYDQDRIYRQVGPSRVFIVNVKDGSISFIVESYRLEVARFSLAELENRITVVDQTEAPWQIYFFICWPDEVRRTSQISTNFKFNTVLDIACRVRDLSRYSVIVLYGANSEYSTLFKIAHRSDIITVPINNDVLTSNILSLFPLCVDDGSHHLKF